MKTTYWITCFTFFNSFLLGPLSKIVQPKGFGQSSKEHQSLHKFLPILSNTLMSFIGLDVFPFVCFFQALLKSESLLSCLLFFLNFEVFCFFSVSKSESTELLLKYFLIAYLFSTIVSIRRIISIYSLLAIFLLVIGGLSFPHDLPILESFIFFIVHAFSLLHPFNFLHFHVEVQICSIMPKSPQYLGQELQPCSSIPSWTVHPLAYLSCSFFSWHLYLPKSNSKSSKSQAP